MFRVKGYDGIVVAFKVDEVARSFVGIKAFSDVRHVTQGGKLRFTPSADDQ
jgi:hypothetical protein